MDIFLRDLRYAWRSLQRQPAFTTVAIVALSLGIGAVTAIFSVVNAVLLRPLPFTDSDMLVLLRTVVQNTGEPLHASYPDFLDWRDQSAPLMDVAAMTETTLTLAGRDGAERVAGELVSSDFFPLLGVRPLTGRFFQPEEDLPGKATPVVVLSFDLWRARFSADQKIVGRAVRLNDQEYVVVGIAPENFAGFTGESQVWVPLSLVDRVAPHLAALNLLGTRNVRWHQVIGRLRMEVSLERARQGMKTIATRLAAEYPDTNADVGVIVSPAQEELVKDFRKRLLTVLGAAGFVLLIACANLANLLLTRVETRSREIALRLAVGAARPRIIRLLLTESMLLGLIGGGLGLAVAYVGKCLLIRLLPIAIPAFVSIEIDGTVLGFTLLISLVTGFIFGLVPALQTRKVVLLPNLKEGGRGLVEGGRRPRMRHFVVVSEVALVLVLLVSSGPVFRSLLNLVRADVGFDRDNLLTMSLDLPDAYSPAKRTAVAEELLARLGGLPMVQEVALSNYVFFGDGWVNRGIAIEGRIPARPDERIGSFEHVVTPAFFRTMRIPLLAGRGFDGRDSANSPATVIVSEALAKRYWPARDALGKRIRSADSQDEPWKTIVGLAGNVRHRSLAQLGPDDPDIYLPLAQHPASSLGLLVRTSSKAAAATPALRDEIRRIDPEIVVYGIETMEGRMRKETSEARFTAFVTVFFASLAFVLAVTGIYSVLALAIGRRRREVAVRMFLGATRGRMLRLLLRESMTLVLGGTALGLLVAYAVSRLLAPVLFRVDPHDLVTFTLVPTLLLAVVLAVSYLPAAKATRGELSASLKDE